MLVQNESSWDSGACLDVPVGDESRQDGENEGLHLKFPGIIRCRARMSRRAFHTSEVPYVMNALAMSECPFTDQDRRIADMLSS